MTSSAFKWGHLDDDAPVLAFESSNARLKGSAVQGGGKEGGQTIRQTTGHVHFRRGRRETEEGSVSRKRPTKFRKKHANSHMNLTPPYVDATGATGKERNARQPLSDNECLLTREITTSLARRKISLCGMARSTGEQTSVTSCFQRRFAEKGPRLLLRATDHFKTPGFSDFYLGAKTPRNQKCSDCEVSAKLKNHAWMRRLLQGTNHEFPKFYVRHRASR